MDISSAYQRKVEQMQEEIKRVCEFCGKELTTTDLRKKYCNAECREEFWELARKGKPEILKCPTCGKTFIKRGRKKYCCDSCRDSMNSAKRSKDKREAKLRNAAERRAITSNIAIENEKARDLNMTYGQYKAMQYMKTTEAIKIW